MNSTRHPKEYAWINEAEVGGEIDWMYDSNFQWKKRRERHPSWYWSDSRQPACVACMMGAEKIPIIIRLAITLLAVPLLKKNFWETCTGYILLTRKTAKKMASGHDSSLCHKWLLTASVIYTQYWVKAKASYEKLFLKGRPKRPNEEIWANSHGKRCHCKYVHSALVNKRNFSCEVKATRSS